MPVDTFLEFQGGNSFEGESQDDKYKDCIEILSYNLGVSNSGSGAVGGGSGTSRAHFTDISITKCVDKSSPNFFACCASGAHIDKAFIHVRKAGEKPQEYLTITMEEVFISGYNHSNHDGALLPTENVTLNFAKIEFKYSQQQKDGSLGPANPKGWDIKGNKTYAA